MDYSVKGPSLIQILNFYFYFDLFDLLEEFCLEKAGSFKARGCNTIDRHSSCTESERSKSKYCVGTETEKCTKLMK